MKIEIEPTSKIVEIQTPTGTVPARIWEGKTDRGTPVHCYVTRICPSVTEPVPESIVTEFTSALEEASALHASDLVRSIPLRLIL